MALTSAKERHNNEFQSNYFYALTRLIKTLSLGGGGQSWLRTFEVQRLQASAQAGHADKKTTYYREYFDFQEKRRRVESVSVWSKKTKFDENKEGKEGSYTFWTHFARLDVLSVIVSLFLLAFYLILQNNVYMLVSFEIMRLFVQFVFLHTLFDPHLLTSKLNNQ